MNRVIKTINAEGGIIENIYDLVGNLVETIDPLGNSVYYGYDSLGRNTIVRTPFENDTYSSYRTFYDNNGNVSTTVDPLGNSTRYNFNNRGFLISVELGAGTNDSLLTRYSYDEEGRLETTVTGLSNILDRDYAVKSYEYNSLGRLISETDPEGNQTLFEYDSNGNILRKTNRNGITNEYKYDGLNRIVSEKNSKDGDEEEIQFAYDLLANTVRMADVTGNTIYEYDNLGRVNCIDYGDGIRQLYTYDSSDQVTNLRLERNGIDELDMIVLAGFQKLKTKEEDMPTDTTIVEDLKKK